MKYLFREILLFSLIPLIILWVNSNHGIHSKDFNQSLVDYLIKYDSISIQVNINERGVTRERVRRDSVNLISTVVLGSSRSMLFGEPIGRVVKNYSMSGAILSDFENVYSEMKNSSVRFDTIYIEVSPWIFNSNVEERRFEDWEEQNHYDLRTLKKYLSVKYFLDNISLNKFERVVDEDKFIRYSDGTIKYDREYRTGNSRRKILDYISKFPVYHLEGFNEINNLKEDGFVKLISELKSEGKFVFLVKHPYPPSINDSIISIYPNIEKTELILNSLEREMDVTIIGSFYPDRLGIIDSDYYDGMHLTPSGLSKLLN